MKLWSMKCQDCGGSGAIPDMHSGYDNNGDMQYEMEAAPCPTCHGSGDMELVAEEVCTEKTDCDNIDFPNCKITERHYYKSGGYKGIKSCKGFLYRPLTEAEVEDVLLTSEKYEGACIGITAKQMGINDLIETYLNIKDNPLTSLTYKGNPVTLRAKGE